MYYKHNMERGKIITLSPGKIAGVAIALLPLNLFAII